MSILDEIDIAHKEKKVLKVCIDCYRIEFNGSWAEITPLPFYAYYTHGLCPECYQAVTNRRLRKKIREVGL